MNIHTSTNLLQVEDLEFTSPPLMRYPKHVTKMVEYAGKQWSLHQKGSLYATPGFDQESEVLSAIKAGATSWQALEIIYNFQATTDQQANLWVGTMANAQAVRNRLRGLKVLLHDLLLVRSHETGRGTKEKPLLLLSLAAGSAQGVLEVVSELREVGVYTHVTLIDSDSKVKQTLDNRISSLDLSECVNFIARSAFKFKAVAGGPFDLVEMAGLMDYLQFKFAVLLCRQIRSVLCTGGHFVTCHIHENPEMDFMRYVIDWGVEPLMLYRSKEELVEIMVAAGFQVNTTWTEPHGIHTIAAGQSAASR